MMDLHVLSNVMGVCGIIIFVVMFHFGTMKNVLKMKMIMDVFWALHFLFIGATSAFATNMICFVRENVFIRNDKKLFSGKIWLYIFVAFNLISAVLTWKGVFSILPAIASSLATYSFWQKNVNVARVIGFANNILMFTYDVTAGSVMGMIGEALAFVSVIAALIKSRRMEDGE